VLSLANAAWPSCSTSGRAGHDAATIGASVDEVERNEFSGGTMPMTLLSRQYVAWSANDIATLKDYPASVIARELERTAPAVVRKARELKLSMRVRRPKREGQSKNADAAATNRVKR
jgi:hypothetical protein